MIPVFLYKMERLSELLGQISTIRHKQDAEVQALLRAFQTANKILPLDPVDRFDIDILEPGEHAYVLNFTTDKESGLIDSFSAGLVTRTGNLINREVTTDLDGNIFREAIYHTSAAILSITQTRKRFSVTYFELEKEPRTFSQDIRPLATLPKTAAEVWDDMCPVLAQIDLKLQLHLGRLQP